MATQPPNLGPNPEKGTVAASVERGHGRVSAPGDDAALLLQAKKRFQTAASREAKLRNEMLLDQRFRNAEHWPTTVKAEREMDGRPCLTVNRLPTFIRQVTNQQRQSKPAIVINPVDSGSDPQTAEVLQGIIRHIEVNSQADIAYDTACDNQVTMGRGFFRVVTEWNDVNEWEQDVKIKRIRNPFTVYFDPACVEADYHDARFAFVIEDIPKDEFVARYGEDVAKSAEIFASIGDRSPDWMPEGKVRIAEYYYVVDEDESIALLSDGTTVPGDNLKDSAFQQMITEAGLRVIRTRKVSRRKVKWAKITGSQVLEKRDWPGRWIPIIPVLGDEVDINGEVDIRGMVRDARDPQRIYDYWVSAETETIALAPRAPFVGAEGQFEGHEAKWKLANRRNLPYLEYKMVELNGNAAPPPQRNAVEPPIAAIAQAIKQADNDLKAVTGIYDASLGERGPSESAKAILSRQKQSDIANVNWIDNLSRAMRALGRVLLDLIPKVYDVPRVMRILGMDDQPRMVLVHADNADAITEDMKKGIAGIYDLAVGRYDVTVTVGQSFQSKREEAVAAMTAFMEAFPPAAPAIGDILADNMDWPGAQLVAKRLRKMVPPQLLDAEDGADPEQQLTAAQQKLQQSGQMLQALTQQLTQAKELLLTKKQELDSKERIAAMQMHTQIIIAQITATKDATLQSDAQNHEALLAAMEGEQETQQGHAELVQQAQSQALDQQHQRELAAIKFQHEAAMKLHDAAIKGNLAVQQAKLKGATELAKQRTQIAADQQTQQRDQAHQFATGAAEAGHQAQQDAMARRHEAEMTALQQQHDAEQAGLDREQATLEGNADRQQQTNESARDRAHASSEAQQNRAQERVMTATQQAFEAQQSAEGRDHELNVLKQTPKPTKSTK